MVGAVEAQKAEGVLHLHLLLFLQMAMQLKTLKEIAEMFQRGLLHVSDWKTYMDSTRIASYPNLEQVEQERPAVERSWLAFASDLKLNRPPLELFQQHNSTTARTPVMSLE